MERGRTCDVLHRIVVRARNSKELSKKKKRKRKTETEKRERPDSPRRSYDWEREREREKKSIVSLRFPRVARCRLLFLTLDSRGATRWFERRQEISSTILYRDRN